MSLGALAVMLILTRGCHETSNSLAVGLANCHKFGDWSMAPSQPWLNAFPEPTLGVELLQLDALGAATCTFSGKKCGATTDVTSGGLGGVRTALAVVGVRLAWVHGGVLRFGPLVQFGLAPNVQLATTLGRVTSVATSMLAMELGAELRWWRLGLNVSAAAGLQTLDAGLVGPSGQWYSRTGPVLLPRLGFRVWVTPMVALDATGAMNVLEPSRVTLTLGLHLPFEPFDGRDPTFG
jgi:hypothetical protein